MRCELAQPLRFRAFQRGRAIGNPDTLVIEIHLTGLAMASSFFWTRTGKKRTVEHAQLQVSRGVRYSHREKARIFVIDVAQLDAVPMSIGCKPETLPME
jgi:hypothetical protein